MKRALTWGLVGAIVAPFALAACGYIFWLTIQPYGISPRESFRELNEATWRFSTFQKVIFPIWIPVGGLVGVVGSLVIRKNEKRYTNAKLCWCALALCGFLLTLANLGVMVSTAGPRRATNLRIASLTWERTKAVAPKVLRDTAVDLRLLSEASSLFLHVNVYLPGIIFIIAVIGAVTASRKKRNDCTTTG